MIKKILILFFLLYTTSSFAATNYLNDANIVGAWMMTSNGGTETEVTGNGSDLTEVGGTIPTSADMPSGYSGSSRDFEDGDTEWLEQADGLSTDISGADQEISIVCWFKPEHMTQVGFLVSKYDFGGVNDRQYRFGIGVDPLEGFISGDGTSGVGAKPIAGTTLSAGTWYHGAIVYDDTDIRIYLDGVLDNNGASNPITYSSGISNEPSPFSVGVSDAGATPGQYFDGLITEVAVFDRALSAAEVLEIKNNGLAGTFNLDRRFFLTQ